MFLRLNTARMPEDDDILDAIESSATGPKKVTGDQGSMEQHSLSDQIAADKYKRSFAATRSSTLGIRTQRFLPGGAA